MTKKIEYKDDHVTAIIEVRQATVRDGLNRVNLISAMEESEDPIINYYNQAFYPGLIASSQGEITIDGEEKSWPPSIEEFMELPEQLADEWFEAVRKANPHWFNIPPELLDEKKGVDASGD